MLSFLLTDNFSTALAAGSVNGTPADGTGQTRVVIDTAGTKLAVSVANGLEFVGATGAGDPGIWYPQITREIGLTVGWRVKPVSGTHLHQFGWDSNQSGIFSDGVYFVTGILRAFYNQAQRDILAGVYVNGTTYDCITIMRNPGVWVLVKGGVYTEWSLGFVYNAATFNPFPSAQVNSAPGTGTVYARKTNVARLSQWATQFANATERKAISVNADTIAASAGNALIEHTIVAATGVTQELMVRRTDDDNCVIIRMDQTAATIKVYEKIAGVETELTGGTTTQTWTNGASFRIFVSLYGTAIKVTVNISAKNDATGTGFNASVTGVKVSHAGTDLIAWPITPPAAAIAELNQFFPA